MDAGKMMVFYILAGLLLACVWPILDEYVTMDEDFLIGYGLAVAIGAPALYRVAFPRKHDDRRAIQYVPLLLIFGLVVAITRLIG